MEMEMDENENTNSLSLPERKTIKVPPVTAKHLHHQPANPSLTSAATGRVFFQPELLGLFSVSENEGNLKELSELQMINETTFESVPVYEDGNNIKGTVFVKVSKSAGSIGHYGIKIEFIGILSFPGNLRSAIPFCHLTNNLAAEGKLDGGNVTPFPFEFKHVEMAHESYNGRHVQIKYFIKVIIKRGLGDVVGQRGIWVQDYTPVPDLKDSGWQLEVGLEDQLHINFTSPISRYDLNENIEGELHFSLVNLKIKSVDLSLVRREIVGTQITDQEVLQRYQIIEGSPARYDTIPFRLPLKNLRDLTPSLREIEKAASLIYFVNLIIYDIDGRRYFKQQEIYLYRKQKDRDLDYNFHKHDNSIIKNLHQLLL